MKIRLVNKASEAFEGEEENIVEYFEFRFSEWG